MTKIKDIHIEILFLILLCLIFLLWGRILYTQMNQKSHLENIYTKEARMGALSHFGWEVFEDSEQKEIILIPKNFDKVYKDYNELQKLSGFDLTLYKGCEVEKYTYVAKNFPQKTNTDVYINILIKDGHLLGGDCMTTALSGFMLPLDRRFLP